METILIQFKLKWRFKKYHHYKITTCKRVINCQTNRIIKKTTSGRSVGYNIGSTFYKLSDINKYIELIPKSDIPF